jgi:hypothetical protein
VLPAIVEGGSYLNEPLYDGLPRSRITRSRSVNGDDGGSTSLPISTSAMPGLSVCARRPPCSATFAAMRTDGGNDRTRHQLAATGNYNILRRLIPRECTPAPAGASERFGIIVDLETTGLDPLKDEVRQTEVALDQSGRLFAAAGGLGEF